MFHDYGTFVKGTWLNYSHWIVKPTSLEYIWKEYGLMLVPAVPNMSFKWGNMALEMENQSHKI